MFSLSKKLFIGLVAVVIIFAFLVASGYSEVGKMGYVDLKRAFYEYEKTKTMETKLNDLTENRQDQRNKMIERITKLRDKVELLRGGAKTKKQGEIDVELVKLQEFDRETRQELLTKKNDMFREVVEDIQSVVEEIGKKEGYDYILDSRNIMYANKGFDLTDKVVKQLNK